MQTCKRVRPALSVSTKQNLDYFEGIASETTGATGLCMHLLTIPPGACGKVHLHAGHETAIYQLSGSTEAWYGDRLEGHTRLEAGDMFYIPSNIPHLPANLGVEPATVLVARTDPNEQESVHLCPDLEALGQALFARRLAETGLSGAPFSEA